MAFFKDLKIRTKQTIERKDIKQIAAQPQTLPVPFGTLSQILGLQRAFE